SKQWGGIQWVRGKWNNPTSKRAPGSPVYTPAGSSLCATHVRGRNQPWRRPALHDTLYVERSAAPGGRTTGVRTHVRYVLPCPLGASVAGAFASAELARDVRRGALIARQAEDLLGCAVLDQLAGPRLSIHIHERRVVRHARRLLHVVRHDRDR